MTPPVLPVSSYRKIGSCPKPLVPWASWVILPLTIPSQIRTTYVAGSYSTITERNCAPRSSSGTFASSANIFACPLSGVPSAYRFVCTPGLPPSASISSPESSPSESLPDFLPQINALMSALPSNVSPTSSTRKSASNPTSSTVNNLTATPASNFSISTSLPLLCVAISSSRKRAISSPQYRK